MSISFVDGSSSTHTWDAFQLAHASFRLYCLQKDQGTSAKSHKACGELGPCLFGDHLKVGVELPEADIEEEEEEEDSSAAALFAIKIHDDDLSLRFLVCGVTHKLDASLLEPLKDGLHALLNIEIRGSNFMESLVLAHHRFRHEHFLVEL